MALIDELFIGSARGSRGSKSETKIEWLFIKDLSEEDVPELLNPPTFDGARTLTRLRERHHYLARLLAGGTSNVEASIMTGYSESYISMMKNEDPAFIELLDYYGTQKEKSFLQVHERLAMLGTSVIEEIHDRFDENPAAFTLKQLQDLAEMTLDRSIAPIKSGPKMPQQGTSTGVALNIVFQAPQGSGVVIEGKAERVKIEDKSDE